MKKMFFTLCSIISLNTLAALPFVGMYRITMNDNPYVEIFITLAEDGSVELIESSVAGALSCTGTVKAVGNDLQSHVVCENGVEYTSVLYDVNKIATPEDFSADVTSSLYGNQKVTASFVQTSKDQLVQEHESYALLFECLKVPFGEARNKCMLGGL